MKMKYEGGEAWAVQYEIEEKLLLFVFLICLFYLFLLLFISIAFGFIKRYIVFSFQILYAVMQSHMVLFQCCFWRGKEKNSAGEPRESLPGMALPFVSIGRSRQATAAASATTP